MGSVGKQKMVGIHAKEGRNNVPTDIYFVLVNLLWNGDRRPEEMKIFWFIAVTTFIAVGAGMLNALYMVSHLR